MKIVCTAATLVLLVCITGCEDSTPIPLDVMFENAKDFASLTAKVRTLPETDVTLGGETKTAGATGLLEFPMKKSTLKVGDNTLAVSAVRNSFASKRSTVANANWVGTPNEFLRFHASGGDAPGTLTCSGPLCADASFKWNKDGTLRLDLESAVAATVTLADQTLPLAVGNRATASVQLWNLAGAALVTETEAKVTIPVALEQNGVKQQTTLVLAGAAIADVVARRILTIASSPVRFPKEEEDAVLDSALVAGVKDTALVSVGQTKRFQDVDLVGIATESERDFSCTGAAAGTSIVYHDLSVRMFERRTGKFVAEKKVSADRVACPPKSTGARSQVFVRENDIKQVVGELLKKK
jgi:hypothetical protein